MRLPITWFTSYWNRSTSARRFQILLGISIIFWWFCIIVVKLQPISLPQKTEETLRFVDAPIVVSEYPPFSYFDLLNYDIFLPSKANVDDKTGFSTFGRLEDCFPIQLTGIVKIGALPFAVLMNNGYFQTGSIGSKIFEYEIIKIEDKSVVLKKNDEEITVFLKE